MRIYAKNRTFPIPTPLKPWGLASKGVIRGGEGPIKMDL